MNRRVLTTLSTLLTLTLMSSAASAQSNSKYNCNSKTVKQVALRMLARAQKKSMPVGAVRGVYERNHIPDLRGGKGARKDTTYINGSSWNAYGVDGGKKNTARLFIQRTGGVGANVFLCPYIYDSGRTLSYDNLKLQPTKVYTVRRLHSNSKDQSLSMGVPRARKYKTKNIFYLILVEDDASNPLSSFKYKLKFRSYSAGW